jgi:hypothetical protein
VYNYLDDYRFEIMFSRILKQSAALLLVVSFLIPSSLLLRPQKAEAQTACVAAVAAILTTMLGASVAGVITGIPVHDLGTHSATGMGAGFQYGEFFTGCILKPIAIAMARSMVRNISNSIINWINSDFEGRPGFVTDINSLLADSADQAIGGFIYGSELGFLCQPFSARIRLTLATKYSKPFREQVRCTLTDIAGNVSNFANNNGGAGWNRWLSITTEPQNNVYGAYIVAESELAKRVQNSLGLKKDELARGNGFLDRKVCDERATDKETTEEVRARIAGARASMEEYGNQYVTQADLDPTPRCKTGGRTVTVGKLAQEAASKVLDGYADQLNLATEIDQIVGALISHFADKMITGAQGFLGLSSSGGYARRNVSYAQASTIAGDVSNPENAGLSDANAAARAGAATILPATSIGTGESLSSGRSASASRATSDLSWATDGNPLTSAKTAEDSNPWIEIDLGSSMTIGEVHIWSPRGTRASESIGEFDVVISESIGGRDWVSPVSRVSDANSNPIVVEAGKTGRYVRVERFNNSYNCGDTDTGYSLCYHALEVGEIEIVADSARGTTMDNFTSGGQAPAAAPASITIGPVTGATNISQGRALSIAIPVNATRSTSIPTLEVRLYSGNSPIAWSSLFTDASIGLSQNGVTRNFYPGSSPGLDFKGVLAGGSYNTSVTLQGSLVGGARAGSYRVVVTAQDASFEELRTATINFVVQ